MKNVWLTPIEPMYVQGCKVIKILAIPSTDMINKENKRLSELNNKKKRPVMHVRTNKVYSSLIEAARAHGVSASSISRVCNGKQMATKGHEFTYVKDK